MDDLARWLGKQLDTDTAVANAALAERGGIWTYTETPGGDHRVLDSLGYSVVEYPPVESEPWFTLPHIAEWDSSRVLREIDSKRRTLIRCEEAMLTANPMLVHFAGRSLRDMARAYEHRPGYAEAIASAR